MPCPVGTWSNSTGLRSAEECQSCPGGFYCASTGLTEPSGLCSNGYEPSNIYTITSIQMPSLTYGIMFPQKVLLCQDSWDSHPYWWGLWPHLPRGSLLSSRNHSPCAVWSWDFCNRHSSLSVLALHSWLVLCGWSPAAVPSWLVLWSLVGYVWNAVLVYCLLDAALVYSANNFEKKYVKQFAFMQLFMF